jgi:hypothetical protein
MKKTIISAVIAAASALCLAPMAHADAFTTCPSGHTGVVTGTPTSCAFADNVRRGFFNQGMPSTVIAYSPVTGGVYSMNCLSSTENVSGVTINGWTCYGGNDAEVVIWA